MNKESITIVTDKSFESTVLNADLPTLVDFWAPWCAPCKHIMPILNSIAIKYEDKVNFVKIDVSENKTIPMKYNIRGIPTLVLFKEGNPIATHVGSDLSESSISSFIDGNL